MLIVRTLCVDHIASFAIVIALRRCLQQPGASGGWVGSDGGPAPDGVPSHNWNVVVDSMELSWYVCVPHDALRNAHESHSHVLYCRVYDSMLCEWYGTSCACILFPSHVHELCVRVSLSCLTAHHSVWPTSVACTVSNACRHSGASGWCPCQCECSLCRECSGTAQVCLFDRA